MKKILFCMIISILFMLASCGSQHGAESIPSDTISIQDMTQVTQKEEAPVQTQQQETESSFSPSGESVSEQRLAEITGLYDDPIGWYSRAATSFYDEASGIDLHQFFYNGIPWVDNTMTEEETAFLKTTVLGDFLGYYDFLRIPAPEMDAILNTYFGTSLESHSGKGLEEQIYWEQTESYYFAHTDSNVIDVLVYGAWLQDDGSIGVYYCDGMFDDQTVPTPDYVMTLRYENEKYLICANEVNHF